MRTTTTLAAAAILAAGLASSMAQNVYSLNIVGYVNQTLPPGYSLIANPLSNGSNGADVIMPLADGSIFLTWNGTSFVFSSYDTAFGGWIDAAQNPSVPPILPPGKGFFYYNPNPSTVQTWVGNVVPNPGGTSSLTLPSGFSLIGSVKPVSGPAITAAPVGLPLLDGMIIQKWTGTTYTYNSYDTAFGGWINASQNPAPEPGYTVGEGFFFYNPTVSTPWVQTLP